MNKETIYIVVEVKDALPPYTGWFTAWVKGRQKILFFTNSQPDTADFYDGDVNVTTQTTHWLKRVERYVLTQDQLWEFANRAMQVKADLVMNKPFTAAYEVSNFVETQTT